MSITNARNFIEKFGCGTAVGIGLIVVMVASVFNGGSCGGAQAGNSAQEGPKTEVGAIFGEKVYLESIRELVDRQASALSSTPDGLSPQMHARLFGDATVAAVDRVVIAGLAKENGVNVTVDDAKAEAKKDAEMQAEQQLMMVRQQLVSQKKLAANATETQFADAFKKEGGQDLSAAKQAFVDQMVAQSTSDEGIKSYMLNLSAKKVREAMARGMAISDEELKKSGEVFKTRRIIKYPSEKKSMDELAAEIQSVYDDLKAGKITFEAAQKQFTDDPVKDSTVDYTRANLDFDVALGQIKDMKIGDYTAVIRTSGGPAIYRLEKVTPKDPDGFATDKEKIRTQLAESRAQRKLFDSLRERITGKDAVWKSPTIKALLDWRIADSDPKMNADPKALTEKYKSMYETLKGGTDSVVDADTASYARFGLFDAWFSRLTKQEQEAARATQIEELSLVIDKTPHLDTRLDLVGYAIDAGQGDLALNQFKEAALVNGGDDEAGERRYKRMQDFMTRMKAKSMLNETQTAEVQAALAVWPKSVFDSLKTTAESNMDFSTVGESLWRETNAKIDRFLKAGYISTAQATELRTLQANWPVEKKKFDAEQAKAEADAKKAADEAEKAAKAATGSTGGAPSGGTAGAPAGTTGGSNLPLTPPPGSGN